MRVKKFDSINVIPFIDVLLVLLAIVLMTSTFIAKGVIPISLPKASSSQTLKLKKEISLFIKENGTIYYEKSPILVPDLMQKLYSTTKDSPVLINSDKEAKFDVFVTVLDALKTDGFENISIVTEKQ